MKKLLFILTILLAVSCTTTIDQARIKEPEKVTTVDIQQNVIDSCAVLATNSDHTKLYVMENGLAVQQYQVVYRDHIVVHEVFILVFIVLIVAIFIFIIAVLTD